MRSWLYILPLDKIVSTVDRRFANSVETLSKSVFVSDSEFVRAVKSDKTSANCCFKRAISPCNDWLVSATKSREADIADVVELKTLIWLTKLVISLTLWLRAWIWVFKSLNSSS